MDAPSPAGLIFPSESSRPILNALREKFDRLALPCVGHAAYEDYVLHKYKLASLQGLTRDIEREQKGILGNMMGNEKIKAQFAAKLAEYKGNWTVIK